MEKNCTKCLKALPSDSTFCPACGTSVISTTSPTNDAVPTNWTHKPAIVVPLAVTASILVIALVGALVSNSSNGSSNNATKSNSSASSDGLVVHCYGLEIAHGIPRYAKCTECGAPSAERCEIPHPWTASTNDTLYW